MIKLIVIISSFFYKYLNIWISTLLILAEESTYMLIVALFGFNK